jgi:5-methylcytosine-specific restriction endonuclease McrA
MTAAIVVTSTPMTREEKLAAQREYSRKWREKNREQQRQYFARYRAEHPELKAYHANYARTHDRKPLTEAQRERAQEWRRANRARRNEWLRQWQARNPDRAREIERRHAEKRKPVKRIADRIYRQQNPETYNASVARAKAAKPELYRQLAVLRAQRRRSRRRALPIEPVSILLIVSRDRSACHLCGGQVARTERSLDHLIPVVRGGAFAEWNLMLAHVNCNRRRRDKQILPEETREAAEKYIAMRIRDVR